MLGELLAHPEVEEVVELRSRFGFAALHGGSLERRTAEIAAAAAEGSGASLYGVIQPVDFRWHVPSSLYDPDHSERLRSFLGHVEVCCAIHGYGRPNGFTTVLLGGRNRDLARDLADRLRPRLPEYEIVDDLQQIPRELRGQHPDNPVNRPALAGVQVELPPRVRGLGPFWDGYEGPIPHYERLLEGLIDLAVGWER